MDRTVASILPKLPDVMKRNRIKENHAPARTRAQEDTTEETTQTSTHTTRSESKWEEKNGRQWMCLWSEWKESIHFLHLTILDSTNISPIYTSSIASRFYKPESWPEWYQDSLSGSPASRATPWTPRSPWATLAPFHLWIILTCPSWEHRSLVPSGARGVQNNGRFSSSQMWVWRSCVLPPYKGHFTI